MLPRPAFLLGIAGLLPAFAAVAAFLLAPDAWRATAFRGGALYAGLIFSFLGGTWWALATRAEPARQWPLYIFSVIPSLAALALLMLLTPGRLVLLGGLILLTLPIDNLLVRLKLAPANWMQLRVPLTLGLSAATAGLGLAAMG
ncbi:MAG: DUF3429 domain-containing protein [Sandaracinobacteroides sp.]